MPAAAAARCAGPGSASRRLLLVLAVAGPAAAAVASLLVSRSRRCWPPLLGTPGGHGRLARSTEPGWITAGWALVVGVLAVTVAVFLAHPRRPGLAAAAPPAQPRSNRDVSTGCTASITRCQRTIARLTQHRVLQRPARGQLGHRAVPGPPRLPAGAGRADRLQLRHGGQARRCPTLSRRGHRHDGLRRPVDDQRRVLQQLVPRLPGRHRDPQLPGQRRSPIPRAAGPATTACWPPRSWSRSTARSGEGVGLLGSPCFEIPRSVTRDRQFDDLSTRPGQRRPAEGQEPAQRGHHGPAPARALAVRHRDALARFAAATARRSRTAGSAALGLTRGERSWPPSLFTVVYFVLVERAVTGFRRAAAEVLLDLPAGFLAARAVLEGPVHRLHPDVQRHPVQERHLAAAGGAGRPSRLRRRLLDHRSGPWSASAATPRSTRAASCSAIPWRTAPSSPTTSPSAPGPPSAPAPSSTTGWTMGDGAVLGADSFLMKGEHVPPGSSWHGNPAAAAPVPRGPARSARQRRGRDAVTGQHVAPAPAPAAASAACLPIATPSASHPRTGCDRHDGNLHTRVSPPSAATAAPGRWCSTGRQAAGCTTSDGRGYLDFFAGAGALNYGHNNPVLKEALLDYLAGDGVTHSLDMYTVAKREFLTASTSSILRPRRAGLPGAVPRPRRRQRRRGGAEARPQGDRPHRRRSPSPTPSTA